MSEPTRKKVSVALPREWIAEVNVRAATRGGSSHGAMQEFLYRGAELALAEIKTASSAETGLPRKVRGDTIDLPLDLLQQIETAWRIVQNAEPDSYLKQVFEEAMHFIAKVNREASRGVPPSVQRTNSEPPSTDRAGDSPARRARGDRKRA